ncbi:hypothetical protein [Aurantiacibacter spongiae]|uniref:Uncharacterized protein n=1 Tax=Aurantiacibacter spongiae TaxID=2488860 RepID=A0A3N5DN34_9SPHN|nr:hypothetical protein [Aurantiacibacter spongiae]RPF70441.1 hypothetical protein EG799_01460 [Aurantiacibacter spongiae]
MTTQIGNPFPMFYDLRGRPLDRGSVYIGAVGQDPETSPIDVFADVGLTDKIAQPIRTIGGLMSRDGNAVFAFIADQQYSIRVKDADGATVFYAASANIGAANFQPASDDLDAIAALTTTTFGRQLLTQASATALRAYANIPDALPLTGGTVTGSIKRSTGGGYAYAANPAIHEVRFYFTEAGADDPRTQVGDVWFEEQAP